MGERRGEKGWGRCNMIGSGGKKEREWGTGGKGHGEK